jgi:hypothetical protein
VDWRNARRLWYLPRTHALLVVCWVDGWGAGFFIAIFMARLNGVVPLAALLSAAQVMDQNVDVSACDWSATAVIVGTPLGQPASVKSYVECSFACARHPDCTAFQYTATSDKW